MPITRDGVLRAFSTAERRAGTLATDALAVEAIDRDGLFMAAVDRDRTWAVAIKSLPAVGHVPAIRLAIMSAEYGVRCHLDLDGSSDSVRVSLVRCRTTSVEIKSLFVTFVTALLGDLPSVPAEQTIADAVDRWISLFWHLQSPPRTDVIGLIGELVVLDSGTSTQAWVAAWHDSPSDAVDFGFTAPRLEVEVKATAGRERIHTLAIHQSNAPGVERYFASLMVELRDTGCSVGELAQSIADRLTDEDDRRRFWTVIAEAGGHQLADYLSARFVQDTSVASLAFYPAGDVPAPDVRLPLPAGVSDLHFRSDFSSVAPIASGPILQLRRRT